MLSIKQTRSFILQLLEIPLSAICRGSGDFLFHLMFFPATFFLSGEGFSVVAVVVCITAIDRGVVNLLSDPSLARDN
jgi:ABC-type uncharacterized transport system permease subunit